MSEEQQVPSNPSFEHTPGTQSQQNFNFGMQYALPNATAVLILGILSILTCCCYGVVGLILGIVGLVLSNKDRTLFEANPNAYTMSSFKNLNAGRVCSVIGLILNGLVVVFYIAMFAMFGLATLSDPDALREALEGLQ